MRLVFAPRSVVRIAAVLVLLLAVRFFADPALAAIGLSSTSLQAIGQVLGAYGAVLPCIFLTMVFVLAWIFLPPSARLLGIALLVLHLVTLVVGLVVLSDTPPRLASSLFPPLAIAAVASGSLLSLATVLPERRPTTKWWDAVYLAVLVLIPLIFIMLTAAFLGLGTTPDPGGTLRGDWHLINLPTLFLEILIVGTWSNLVLGANRSHLRRRWFAFLPFLLVPLFGLATAVRPLVGYILSATIAWGANLVVFAPPVISLTLAVFTLACFFSMFLLLPRKERKDAWDLLFLGTLAVILAGFHLSVASVEGLTFGLLLLALAHREWTKASQAGPPGPPSS